MRHGKPQLAVKDHVLILNWNSQGPAVIRQLLQATQSKTIVVLADRDKSDLDSAVAKMGHVEGDADGSFRGGGSGGGDTRSLKQRGTIAQVHTRQGLPFRPEHLALVCASDASIVILLYPEDVGSVAKAEQLKAVTIAALTALKRFGEQSLIVQVWSLVHSGVWGGAW